MKFRRAAQPRCRAFSCALQHHRRGGVDPTTRVPRGEVHRVLARTATQIKHALRTGEDPIQACPHQGSQRAASNGVLVKSAS
jgi:hypothetical protein